jgi:hypothetical protein
VKKAMKKKTASVSIAAPAAEFDKGDKTYTHALEHEFC